MEERMSNERIRQIAAKLAGADSAVAFTGAGISTESGIADFRSPQGVWSRHTPVYFDEFLASHEARVRHWKMKKEAYPEFVAAKPNAGHRALAELEQAGRLVGVITQNIDGLHQDAGSRNVLELHGTGRFVECLTCHKRWRSEEIFARYADREDVPVCDECGGWLKPATVSFGQQLPQDVLAESQRLSMEADVFLAIGSSLVVEPAASMPVYAKRSGAFLAIINRDETPLDGIADVIIRDPIGQTLSGLIENVLSN
jgi:NAD-dependent deacetylase